MRIHRLLTALLLCLAPALLPACATDPTTGRVTMDWQATSLELGLMEADLNDLADLVGSDRDGDGQPDHPEEAEDLRELAGHVHVVKRGVDAYLAGGGAQGQEVFAALDAALEMADQLLDDDDQRIYVAAARLLARRVKAYLPQAPPQV